VSDSTRGILEDPDGDASQRAAGTSPRRPGARGQPPALRAPAAHRQASPDEIERLERFHLGLGSGEHPTLDRTLEVGLWSWLLGASEEQLSEREADSGRGLPADVDVPLVQLWERLSRRTAGAREPWLVEARRLGGRLRALLDRHPAATEGAVTEGAATEGAAIERLRHGLGDLGSRFVDPRVLSSSLRASASGMPALERERIERVLEQLDRLDRLDAPLARPGLLLCERGLARRFGVGLPNGSWSNLDPTPCVEVTDDPCGSLAEAFDRVAREIAEQVAAVRVARLELDRSFDPELHDPALASFDWQAFHADELSLLPPLIAVLAADSVTGDSLGALLGLLRSGRPVHVVVLVDPAAGADTGLGASRDADPFDLGLLALGLRRAIVHHGSLACPEALDHAFSRAAAATCGCLHVIAAPSLARADLETCEPPNADAGALDRLAVASRAHPVFFSEPFDFVAATGGLRLGAGSGGSVSASLAGSGRFQVADEVGGASSRLETTCTFADYALACGGFASDFLAVGDDVEQPGLVPMEDWLARAEPETRELVPFVWAVVDEREDGESVHRLRRLATTRRLALCTRERLDTWRMLERLAGSGRARDVATAVAEPEEQASAGPHAQDQASTNDDQRRAVAQEVVAKLVAALLAEPGANHDHDRRMLSTAAPTPGGGGA
jgi:hypothetical protein